jgi:hypothetical protein
MSVEIRADAMSLDVGVAQPLFRTEFRAGNTIPYAVASDGRFLINRALDDLTPSPITLIVNWPAALRR